MATTVESVLASLHTHLTSQTSLIPSLHAQLGLPPSALIDELNQLHAALVDTVDRKIEERRREVSEWMEKCAEVETDCIKHNKALGSFSKGVTYSVGELRKQQVYDIRFSQSPPLMVYYRLYPRDLKNLPHIATRSPICTGLNWNNVQLLFARSTA